MALQFPPTDTLPEPTTGTLWTDPNGLVWRATVLDVTGTRVVTWTPNSQIEAGAFQYRGFADLTQPIPDADVALAHGFSLGLQHGGTQRSQHQHGRSVSSRKLHRCCRGFNLQWQLL